MSILKKILVFSLCVSVFCFQLPYISATSEAGVTVKNPQMISSSEEEIPIADKAEPSQISGSKWLWALLGVALIGGIIAAAGGGGGGGGSSGDESTTGDIDVSW